MKIITLTAACCTAAILLFSTDLGLAEDRPPELCKEVFDFGLISDSLGTINRNIDSDLVELLMSRSGCQIRTIPMPAKRVSRELRDGKLHMSARFYQTDERDQFLWFAHVQRSKVLGWFRTDHMTMADASAAMESGETILGITAGFKHSASIDRIVADWQTAHAGRTIEFPDRKALFQGLLAGRADIVLLPGSIFDELNSIMNTEGVPLASIDLVPEESGALGGIVLSKSRFDSTEAAYWQKVVRELCEDGSILRVFRRYFRATEEDLACSLRID